MILHLYATLDLYTKVLGTARTEHRCRLNKWKILYVQAFAEVQSCFSTR